MDKLRACIIGTGGIAHCHADGYVAQKDRVDLAACCDIDFEKAKRFAAEYGIPRVYASAAEMFAAEKLDIASVTTWNSAHKECTIAALDAGCDVICEKPMAMYAAEAIEMRDAAVRNGKLLQIGFVRRFGDDAQTLMEMREAGKLGDVYFGEVKYLRRDGCPGGWFKDKAFSGGGPLIDLGVHIIDLARYLAGSPAPVSAYGVTYKNLGPNRAKGGESAWAAPDLKEHPFNVEDMASAMIKFDNGFSLVVSTSFNLNIPGDLVEVNVYGTKAGAHIGGETELYTDLGGSFINAELQGNSKFDFHGAFKKEMIGFVDAVLGVSPCIATADDGVYLMKIIDAIYRSAEIGGSVAID